jgi:predicted dehydrogenase
MGKIRMGMVGGGRGAFIGAVHRIAAAMDNSIDLVCGAFSADAEKSRLSGEDLHLDPSRVYGSWEEMIEKEKALPEDQRMQLVSIVTPNHVHYGPAKAALENGFHVICDKPLCFNMEEALSLQKLVKETGLIFSVTHAYNGYPMVKQAKHMVANGDFGKIRKVVVEYPQGWLSTNLESSDQKQAAWRTDPSKSGIAGSMGDIGTHAENLAEYISGLSVTEMCADISIFVEGRQLDDDGNVLLRFNNGAKGVLHASQICAGEENNINIRVYGEKGSLQWHQQEPNTLVVKWLDQPTQMYRTGVGSLSEAASVHTRTPSGHPEGYLEAFANIYRNTALHIQAMMKGEPQNPIYDYPTIDDGVRGMNFIYKVIESGKSDAKWIVV